MRLEAEGVYRQLKLISEPPGISDDDDDNEYCQLNEDFEIDVMQNLSFNLFTPECATIRYTRVEENDWRNRSRDFVHEIRSIGSRQLSSTTQEFDVQVFAHIFSKGRSLMIGMKLITQRENWKMHDTHWRAVLRVRRSIDRSVIDWSFFIPATTTCVWCVELHINAYLLCSPVTIDIIPIIIISSKIILIITMISPCPNSSPKVVRSQRIFQV